MIQKKIRSYLVDYIELVKLKKLLLKPGKIHDLTTSFDHVTNVECIRLPTRKVEIKLTAWVHLHLMQSFFFILHSAVLFFQLEMLLLDQVGHTYFHLLCCMHVSSATCMDEHISHFEVTKVFFYANIQIGI